MNAPIGVYSRLTKSLPIIIITIHVSFLVFTAYSHSPTLNEPAHVVSGISYWSRGEFSLYSVNPPLIKLFAAIPAFFFSLRYDWRLLGHSPTERTEFLVGDAFMYANQSNAIAIIFYARLACIPLSALGAVICFRWADQLYGRKSGLLSLTLWCFNPSIIAHGSLATPDIGATAIGLLAVYSFSRWTENPSIKSSLLTGICLGFAEASKFTWVCLFVVFPFLLLVHAIFFRASRLRTTISERLPAALLVLSVSVLVINSVYCFSGTLQPANQYRFSSRTLTLASEYISKLFSADNEMMTVRIPFPKDYLTGLDLQQRDMEGIMPSYLNGDISSHGWWYFYLYAMVIKSPLSFLLLILLSLAARTKAFAKIPLRFDEVALLTLPITVFLLASSQHCYTLHYRYVLPALPYLFILVSQSLSLSSRRPLMGPIIIGLAFWYITVCSLSLLHPFSYFNEFAGGPIGGGKRLIHSNSDWGQDLFYLKTWIKNHPDAYPFQLAYFGRIDPRIVGIDFTLPPTSTDLRNARGVAMLRPGYYAISATYLYGYPYFAPDGAGKYRSIPLHAYRYFRRFTPVAIAGYSIYIFNLSSDDIENIKHAIDE